MSLMNPVVGIRSFIFLVQHLYLWSCQCVALLSL